MVKLEVKIYVNRTIGEFQAEHCLAAKAAAIFSLGLVIDKSGRYQTPREQRAWFQWTLPTGAIYTQIEVGKWHHVSGPKYDPLDPCIMVS